jgi:hypothetical protein
MSMKTRWIYADDAVVPSTLVDPYLSPERLQHHVKPGRITSTIPIYYREPMTMFPPSDVASTPREILLLKIGRRREVKVWQQLIIAAALSVARTGALVSRYVRLA